MFSTWYFSSGSTNVSVVWSGMNWLQHWSMNVKYWMYSHFLE
jgi:hypothetical protein